MKVSSQIQNDAIDLMINGWCSCNMKEVFKTERFKELGMRQKVKVHGIDVSDRNVTASLDLACARKGWSMMVPLILGVMEHLAYNIVEIGMGGSSYFLSEIAQKYNVNLYSCDLLYGGRMKWFNKPLFDGHKVFIGTSDKFMEQFEATPSVVFIDGQHDYDVVAREGAFFLDKMPVGGLMLLHDTYPHNEYFLRPDPHPHDVYKYRKDLERNIDVEVLTFPFEEITCGLTMVIKNKPNKDRSHWLQNGRYS